MRSLSFLFLAACQFDYNVDGKSEEIISEDTVVEVIDTETNDTVVTDVPCTESTWYRDHDADGFGAMSEDSAVSACEQPEGYVPNNTDCNDARGDVNPGAAEVCDDIDNDCDGQMNEGLTWTWVYADDDGDGYGNNSDTSSTCDNTLPTEYGTWVWDNTDCDDTNAAVHPGAEEVCDWVQDNNCDGTLDTDELDGSYDSNGDGDYDDEGDVYETTGPDGYTVCYPSHIQNDRDGDGYCGCGLDVNGDGDCMDTSTGDIIYPRDVECPPEYEDCETYDASIYPGNGC